MAHALASSPALVSPVFSSPREAAGNLSSRSALSLAPLRAVAPSAAAPRRAAARAVTVRAAVAAPPKYELPTWARFELGLAAVYWETGNGRPPTAGEMVTVWFNPAASNLTINETFGLAFNGGFNSPIMCGGEPRQMTRKERGPKCDPFFAIKINVPQYAKTLEFSFTDGIQWEGPFVLEFEVRREWQGKPISFFNEGLREEMSKEGACNDAIFPDSVYIQDRCLLPGGLTKEDGASCALDIVPGCMDKESPFYDPLATVDDGSCPIDTPTK